MSYTPQQPRPLNPADERLWATLTHVIAGGLNLISGLWVGFVAAIVTYAVFRNRGPFVRQHTATTLNFQITLLIATIIGYITLVFIIGALILAAVAIVNIVFSIIAALAANRGESYTYPFAIPFFK